MDTYDVYLETSKSRTFAGAVDWPGWCRSGRDEAAALQALFDYRVRYARAIRSARLGFEPPALIAALKVVEKLPGNSTTEFGAPDAAPAADTRPVSGEEVARLQALLRACWKTLDSAARAAAGKELRRGPRGGGRDLNKIVAHVLMAEAAYLGSVGAKLETSAGAEPPDQRLLQRRTRGAMLKALVQSARGLIPARGPRGGLRWTARYFVRRAAWHILDHAWEIEDRTE
jgi:hypothetical protein